MTWATFNAALEDAEDVTTALDALLASAMPELQESLDLIAAGKAGPLLASALKAEEPERRADLVAALEILDPRLGAIEPRSRETDYSNVLRTALVAALIDAELRGDPEGQRRRAVLAAETFEEHLASERGRLGKAELNHEALAGRLLLAGVLQLVVKQLKGPRRSRLRGWRRGRAETPRSS